MRKRLFSVCGVIAIIVIFSACGRREDIGVAENENPPPYTNEATTPEILPEPTFEPNEPETGQPSEPPQDGRELCACGQFFADDVARLQTPPINMRFSPYEWWDYADEAVRATPPINMSPIPLDDFIAGFANVHSFTHLEREDRYNRLVFWTDEPVRDFSFVSLGHTWIMGPIHYFAGPALFTIDEFLPGDAFVLDVNFFHYLIARGGLTFIDAGGERRHKIISESMADGCLGGFLLSYFEDRTAIPPEGRTGGIDPSPEQREKIMRLLGDFELGEAAPLVSYQDDREAFLFRAVYYDRRPTFYGTAFEHGAASDAAAELLRQGYVYFFPLSLYPETRAGDAILVHSERFDRTLLLIDMDYDDWGRATYVIVILS